MKIDEMHTNKKINLLYIFLLFLPLLDLVSSLSSRFLSTNLSLGMFLKSIIVCIGIYYVLFKSASKYRKASIIFFLCSIIYAICYFGFKTELFSGGYLFSEINYLIKFFYFPYMFLIFLNLFDDYGFEESKLDKIMILNLVVYTCLIVIPTVLKINFNSYSNAEYAGSVGWYYSANEISVILLMLFPFIYKLIVNKKILASILFLLSLYMISLIGTKVTLFGIIVVSFVLVLCIIFSKKEQRRNSIIMSLAMFAIVLIVMSNNYSLMNMKTSLKTEPTGEIVEPVPQEDDVTLFIRKYGSILLSGRNEFAVNTWKVYSNTYKPSYLFLGMGFSNTERINDFNVSKLIEIDLLDMFFHLGIVSIVLWLFPFVYTLVLLIKGKKTEKVKMFFFTIIILLTVGISITAGHVFIAPAVSMYVALYFSYLFNSFEGFRKRVVNNKKIAILGLHMGIGGVENVIANTASMLSDANEVEIISLYKKGDSIPFKIDDRVKIIYLMNTVSNRKEFICACKKFNVLSIFKEGFKSVWILLNKNLFMKRYILETDAGIIISTRYAFSKILNEYGCDDAFKTHQEHTYRVDDKYIKRLNKLKNINCIMPASKVMYNAYRGKINTSLEFIPLALNYYPNNKELSKLNNKNLISIGRLEPEKGYLDLIDVMEKVVKISPDVKLNIFGDGSEYSRIEEKIRFHNLVGNIKLWGFKEPEFIKGYMKESSLYVMTSFEESFGLVIVEALSYGVPCISYSSAKGALDNINKNNGFIIENRNANEMANKIIDYLNLPLKDKKKMGEFARDTSKNYKFETIKKKWLKFIKNVEKRKEENL